MVAKAMERRVMILKIAFGDEQQQVDLVHVIPSLYFN